MDENEAKSKVTLIVAITVSIFVILSLVGTFVLAFMEIETGEVWDKVFSIVGVMVGAVAGFMAGQTVERGRPQAVVAPVIVNRQEEAEPEPVLEPGDGEEDVDELPDSKLS